MVKLKTTKKIMKENYYRIISIGYCEADYLLNYNAPFAYSSGSYGWACDYYDINGTLISTGYAPIGSKNINLSYDTISEYNKKAMKIVHSDMKHEQKKAKIGNLLNELIQIARG